MEWQEATMLIKLYHSKKIFFIYRSKFYFLEKKIRNIDTFYISIFIPGLMIFQEHSIPDCLH